jgi:parvulin-like peptidyl-prolyl isomerase
MKRVASALLVAALTLGIHSAVAADQEPAAVVVNGVRIMPWEAEREFRNLLPQTSFHRRLEGERRTELERQALDVLVMKELKRQWAKEEGLSVDASVVDRESTEIRQRFPDDAAYRQALAERDMSEAGLRHAIERDHLAKAVDERVLSAVPEPTSDDVERVFAANRADYVTPESRHVIHTLVYVAPSAGAEVWEQAGEVAAAVAASAREGTTDLPEEAFRRRSDIPPQYRDQTGDLGMIHRGALQAELDEAVFSAAPSDVVGPIRTIYGYSVLQVLSVEPPRQIELEQVRDAIDSQLRREWRANALTKFESRLLAAAIIERGSLSAER